MEKIYGYKEEDVLALAEFLKNRAGKSLSQVFEEFGALHGKAKGTVRNLYYALAKKSNINPDFCKYYLQGKPLSVAKIAEFSEDEERWLLKRILSAKRQGVSVRRAILDLSGGDEKTALRYQNKYRNLIRKNSKLLTAVINEINAEQGGVTLDKSAVIGRNATKIGTDGKASDIISPTQFMRLKKEIDGLVDRICDKLKRENRLLKDRVSALELENLRLNNLLFAKNGGSVVKYFASKKGKTAAK